MTKSDDTKRKRGRPPKSIPDRDWLESEVRQAEALAAWHAEHGNNARAREAMAAAEALRGQAPAKYRASRPIAAYEGRHPVLPWHLAGPIEERKRQALVDAVGAVDTLLRVMHAVQGGLDAGHLDELQRKAEAACAVCEAYWRSDGTGQGQKRLASALDKLPAKLTLHRHNANLLRVLSDATLVHADTVRPFLPPRPRPSI